MPDIDAGSVGFEPAGSAAVGAVDNQPSDPSPIEISEDSLVKLPGMEKPVKYGEHYKGFQSQFTRASQEAARLKQQTADYERRLQESESQRKRYEQMVRGGQPQAPTMQDQLKQLQFLSGEDAAIVYQDLANQQNQRDAVLVRMAQEIQRLSKGYGGLNEQNVNAGFETKIAGWIKDGGYPAELTNFAKELYLAYEGDDLDQEFPAILKQRYDELFGAFRAQERQRVTAARQTPFVPGKGGNGSPSRPLNQGFRTAKQIAEEMWPMMQGPGE